VAGPGDVDAIARLDAGDTGADGFHLAGAVEPRRVGKRRFARVVAGMDVRIDRVHTRGADAHEHFTGAWFGIGDGSVEREHFRSTELLNSNRAHVVSVAADANMGFSCLL